MDEMEPAETGLEARAKSRKMYYTISEVCGLTGLEKHILRYWEGEFPKLRPKKSGNGVRMYRDKDIDLISRIKRLLYEEKYTIHGARQKLADEAAEAKSGKPAGAATPNTAEPPPPKSVPEATVSASVSPDFLAEIRGELEGVLALLRG